MNNLLERFCEHDSSGGLSPELINAICNASEDELRQQFTRATPSQQVAVAVRASDCIRFHKTLAMLSRGMVIHLFYLATPELSRAEQIEIMAKETGVQRTQQYRCRDSFIYMGRPLLKEPKLASRFVTESVNRLSQPSTPETARYESIKRARAGEIIVTEIADSIIAAHLPELTASVSSNTDSLQAACSVEADTQLNATLLIRCDDAASGEDDANATHHNRRRREPDIETIKAMDQKRHEIDEFKASRDYQLGECIHQDNAVQVFVRSVNQKSAPTAEAIHYAIQQAYRKLCHSNPVQAIVADTLEPSR